MVPDSTNYIYAYYNIYNYLPSFILINDVKDLKKEPIYLTFALNIKKA